jgi:signal transduction histidine kinase
MGFVLVVIVGVLDFLTGPEISFSIFYLVPVSLVTWFSGRRVGIFVSIVAAITWLTADLLSGAIYSYPIIPYWNATVRFGFFLIVTLVLSSVRRNQQRREELTEFIFHDLRAPLSNAISGLRIAMEHPGETPEMSENDILKMCLISCTRMSTLIQSLLDLAKLESGKLSLNQKETGVKELLESSRIQISVWARRQQVTVTLHVGPGVQKVYADPLVSERVLVNLLSNAIKSSRPESSVVIEVAAASSDMVAFSVTDQGSGIPKEWTEKVFHKYAQVDLGKMRGEVGLGLGLTFCRLAIQAQGGTIQLVSEVDKGTTARFTLPARP